MSFIQFGALFVESGDEISGTVADGQVLSAVLSSGSAGSGLWAALVDSGGTLAAADIINFWRSRGQHWRPRHRER